MIKGFILISYFIMFIGALLMSLFLLYFIFHAGTEMVKGALLFNAKARAEQLSGLISAAASYEGNLVSDFPLPIIGCELDVLTDPPQVRMFIPKGKYVIDGKTVEILNDQDFTASFIIPEGIEVREYSRSIPPGYPSLTLYKMENVISIEIPGLPPLPTRLEPQALIEGIQCAWWRCNPPEGEGCDYVENYDWLYLVDEEEIFVCCNLTEGKVIDTHYIPPGTKFYQPDWWCPEDSERVAPSYCEVASPRCVDTCSNYEGGEVLEPDEEKGYCRCWTSCPCRTIDENGDGKVCKEESIRNPVDFTIKSGTLTKDEIGIDFKCVYPSTNVDPSGDNYLEFDERLVREISEKEICDWVHHPYGPSIPVYGIKSARVKPREYHIWHWRWGEGCFLWWCWYNEGQVVYSEDPALCEDYEAGFGEEECKKFHCTWCPECQEWWIGPIKIGLTGLANVEGGGICLEQGEACEWECEKDKCGAECETDEDCEAFEYCHTPGPWKSPPFCKCRSIFG